MPTGQCFPWKLADKHVCPDSTKPCASIYTDPWNCNSCKLGTYGPCVDAHGQCFSYSNRKTRKCPDQTKNCKKHVSTTTATTTTTTTPKLVTKTKTTAPPTTVRTTVKSKTSAPLKPCPETCPVLNQLKSCDQLWYLRKQTCNILRKGGCNCWGCSCPGDKLLKSISTTAPQRGRVTARPCVNVTCTAQSQCHSKGICNEVTGRCTNPPAIDGTACQDGNDETAQDVCVKGICSGKRS